MSCDNAPHNRFLLSLAHAVGHPLNAFGNPNLCKGGLISPSGMKMIGETAFCALLVWSHRLPTPRRSQGMD